MVDEMRQQIDAMQAFLSIVLAERTGPLNEQQRDLLESVKSAAGRLELLIENAESAG